MSALGQRWRRYWFAPAPLLDLAVCRIVTVGFQLSVLLFPRAFLTVPPYTRFEVQSTLDASLWDPLPIFRLLTFPLGHGYRPTVQHLESAYLVSVLAGALALVGLWAVVTMPVFVLAVIFMVAHSHSYGEFHHIETIPTMMMIALACSPSSRVLSLDALLRARKQKRAAESILTATSTFAGWPIKLLIWMFALVYLSAALCKLGGGGLAWMNGYTLQYYMLQDASYWGSKLGMWLGHQHRLSLLMSWATMLFEATFAIVIVVPGLRWCYALAGFALHLGIFYAMRAPFMLYLPIYAVLIPWSTWARRGSQLMDRVHGARA